jgi:hypothetical protein
MELRIWLSDVYDLLSQQRTELMDIIQTNKDQLRNQVFSHPKDSSPHRELSVTFPTANSVERCAEWELSFEAVNSRLATQQARLDDIHDALQCVANSSKSMYTSTAQAQDSEVPCAVAMSVLSAVAAAASMFLLGYSAKSVASSSSIWTSFHPENNTSHDSRRTHGNPPHVDPAIKFSAMSKWATEFQSKTQPCQQSLSRRSRERPGGQSNKESPGMQTSRSRNNNSFYEWKCCQCGHGPWGCGTSSCWACCSHERCADCPREFFDNILTSEQPLEGPIASVLATNTFYIRC